MAKSASEFLESAGGLTLFCELSPSGSLFTELDGKLDISHQTLSERLDEAEELGLITTESVRGDRGRTQAYVPTEKGARLMLKLRREGVVSTYRSLKETQRRLDEELAEIREWIDESPEEFYSEEKNREAFQELQYLHGLVDSDITKE